MSLNGFPLVRDQDPHFTSGPLRTVKISVLDQHDRCETAFEGIVGQSSALRRVLQLVETVATGDSTVLLLGETGTGKELIARAIHYRSQRRSRAFAKLNCAAIPSGLLESELFGHERGAFTGAITQKTGRIEVADQGSLFLDEIGDIPLELQPKLLRVLQEREFERLGSTRTKKVDVRIVAATHRDLEDMIVKKEFRSDLYYRLNVFPISIPPLRERPEDVPLLARHFVQEAAQKMNKTIDTIPPGTMEALTQYAWPGNIRELENMIKRYVILGSEDVISNDLVARSEQEFFNPDINLDGPISLKVLTRKATRELERKIILKVLQAHHWNRKQAARALSISYRALLYKIRDAGLPPNRSTRRRTETAVGADVAAD